MTNTAATTPTSSTSPPDADLESSTDTDLVVGAEVVGFEELGFEVVGPRVGAEVVGSGVVGTEVAGPEVVGAKVVGFEVVGPRVGAEVAGPEVVGAKVVGFEVLGGRDGVGVGAVLGHPDGSSVGADVAGAIDGYNVGANVWQSASGGRDDRNLRPATSFWPEKWSPANGVGNRTPSALLMPVTDSTDLRWRGIRDDHGRGWKINGAKLGKHSPECPTV